MRIKKTSDFIAIIIGILSVDEEDAYSHNNGQYEEAEVGGD